VANTKTAKKQLQITRRNQARNQHFKTVMKTAIKRAHSAIEAGEDPEAARVAVSQAVRSLHRTASKGVIKRQNASRRASRLMRAYNVAFAQAKPAPAAEGAE
jgi:small subunit ribosomal protein S20